MGLHNNVIFDSVELETPTEVTVVPIQLLLQREKKRSSSEPKLISKIVTVGGALYFLYLIFNWLTRLIDMDFGNLSTPAWIVFSCSAIFVSLWIVRILSLLLTSMWSLQINDAVKSGDYERTNGIIQRMKRLFILDITKNTRSSTYFIEGFVHFALGRVSEAIAALEKSIELGGKRSTSAPDYEMLGTALLAQKEYVRAAQAFQKGIVKDNNHAGSHTGLAQTYLEQSLNPIRALTLVEHGLQYAKADRVAEFLPIRAWALILLNHRNEAMDTIKKAFELSDKDDKFTLSQIYYTVGRIMQIAGDETSARKSFQKALESDAISIYGQKAASAMRNN